MSHRPALCPPVPCGRPLAWRAAGGLCLALAAGAAQSQDAEPLDIRPLTDQVSLLVREGARQASLPGARVEVEVGSLDPRLKLAPCRRIDPYLPAGLPAWGKTRVGLRCVDGPKLWNVSLPVTVHVWTRSLVAAGALPAGTVLDARSLVEEEIDLAAAPGAAISQLPKALGRTLARPLAAGTALRVTDLKARQWFAAGETVRVVAVGQGWRISTEGEALNPGVEGQAVRVRTDGGRVVQGRAVADREVEVAL